MSKTPLTKEERAARRRESQRRYYLKNKDRILAYQDKWYAKNKIKVKDNLKKWRADNKSQFLETDREWRKNNLDKARKNARNSYYRHIERRSAERKAWAKRNPGRCVFYVSMRRKRCKLHPDSDRSKIAAIYKESKLQSIRLNIKTEIDHIIPVERGGFHHENNLQILTKRMNSSKGMKPFWLSPHAGIKDWRDVPRHLWPVDLAPKYLALIEKHKGETIRWDSAA